MPKPKLKGNNSNTRNRSKAHRRSRTRNGIKDSKNMVFMKKGKVVQAARSVSPRSDSSAASGDHEGACELGSASDSKMAAMFVREPSFDDNRSDLIDDEEDRGFLRHSDSDEDTEDASETDMAKLEEEFTEMKEQMYQEKLQDFKNQLQQLKSGKHQEYLKRLNKLEKIKDDRLVISEICRKYEIELVEKEYIREKQAVQQEYENKKVELKDTLMSELLEKKKTIENERVTMELTGDSVEIKPAVTRKLRRRPNEPLPAPEKRRKTSPQINYLLDEQDIMDDLRALNKLVLPMESRSNSPAPSLTKSSNSRIKGGNSGNSVDMGDVRIEDGKLYYDKKWFSKGTSIIVENRENGKYSGTLSSVGQAEIWVKKTDNTKAKIYLSSLLKGKFTLRKKNSNSS
ncbi:predicted protein [Nematostella vectensis]|uniref:Sin3 histone deacetylase corepressor complex component SDS3 n=1 Tax=Nematostella vectensis TaxID=45351 RepID=A7RV72_NEMVE|nr:sin3 histone deacetylase corepressor complex component SDS3 [Nematostella vectensis]EDO44590.1 predicted protein [Nematostella vectensis]|eukprot:XP_001636653.1 predicted protein [Nematostella vectensis]